jgi:hypothetical protein
MVTFDQENGARDVWHNPSRSIQDEVQHIVQLQRATQSSRNVTERLSQQPIVTLAIFVLGRK